MYKSLFSAGLVALSYGGLTSVSLAQASTTYDAVVRQCELVAIEEARLDENSHHRLRGECINITSSYILALTSQNLPSEQTDAIIGSLVADLAELLLLYTCNLQSEIPDAISIANAIVQDADQQAQIELVRFTVDTCDITVTAAINSVAGIPASAN